MNIRRAQKKDIARIEELLYQVNSVHHNGRPDIFKRGGKKFTKKQLEEIFKNESTPVFVAVDDKDEVTGYVFCILRQHIDDNILTDIKTLFLDDFCVDEKCRAQGIGTELLNYVYGFAEEEGCYNVMLNVWNFNQSAMNFYTRNGMQPLRTYMEKIIK